MKKFKKTILVTVFTFAATVVHSGGDAVVVDVKCHKATVSLVDAQSEPVADTEVHYSVNGSNSGWLPLDQSETRKPYELCFQQGLIETTATIHVKAESDMRIVGASVTLPVVGDFEVEFRLSK